MDQIIHRLRRQKETLLVWPHVLIRVHCEEQPPALISDKPITNHSFVFHTEQCHIPSGCTSWYSEGTIHIWDWIYSCSLALRFAGKPQYPTYWNLSWHVIPTLRNKCRWFPLSDFSWSLASGLWNPPCRELEGLEGLIGRWGRKKVKFASLCLRSWSSCPGHSWSCG